MSVAEYTKSRDGDGFAFVWLSYGFAIGFDGLRQERYGLCGEIYVKTAAKIESTGRPGHVYQGLFNLSKLDERDKLAKALAQRNDQTPWIDLLEIARVETVEEFRRGEPVYRLRDVKVVPQLHLIERMIPLDETSVFYGDGASAKSLIGAAIAVAVATGEQVGPFRPAHVRPVLVLDWETTREEWAERLKRLCDGLGIEVPHAIHYRRQWRTLAEDQSAVRTEVAKLGDPLIIVDSIAPACGGEVNPDNAIPFFNALRSVAGATKLVISHISKATSLQERGVGDPYGSVFVKNFARSAWAIRRDENGHPADFEVSLTHRKVNRGPLQRPVGVRLRFQDPDGPIELLSCDPLANPILSEHASLPDRLRVLLRQGEQTVKYLSEQTGAKENTVRATLSRMRDAQPANESRGRVSTSWRLLTFRKEAP